MKLTHLMIAALLVALTASMSYAQERERRQFDPEQWRQRIEEYRKERAERMRTQLGFEKDEWEQVINPLVEEIQSKQRDVRSYSSYGRMGFSGRGGFGDRGRGGGRGGDRGRGGGERGGEERELSAGQQAVQGLRTLLDDENASPDSIKAALKKVRDGRKAAEKELAASRAKLAELVTAKQEAYFVMNGTLQ